jgi:hypothetical protein
LPSRDPTLVSQAIYFSRDIDLLAGVSTICLSCQKPHGYGSLPSSNSTFKEQEILKIVDKHKQELKIGRTVCNVPGWITTDKDRELYFCGA